MHHYLLNCSIQPKWSSRHKGNNHLSIQVIVLLFQLSIFYAITRGTWEFEVSSFSLFIIYDAAFSDGGLYVCVCDSVSHFFPGFFFLFLSAITRAATTVTSTVTVMTSTVAVSAMQSWLSTQAREAPASCGGPRHVTLR